MKIIMTMLLAVALVGCDYDKIEPITLTKKITHKETAIEQRMGFDFFADEPLRQKTTTIYYLVAEDSEVCEVGLSTYMSLKIGDSFSSNKWRCKE